MGQEYLNFNDTHILGMALVAKEEAAFDPSDAGLFGMDRIVFQLECIANPVEEFFRASGRCFGDHIP